MRFRIYIIGAALFCILFIGCSKGSPENEPNRSFLMGFTPWPYRADGDYAEVLYTYDLIQEQGDIVAHHFQQGIPWPEAYDTKSNPNLSSLPIEIINEVNLRIGQTDRVKKIYLAIDCLGPNRNNLTGYFGTAYGGSGSSEQQPRPNNSGITPDIPGYPNTLDWSSMDFSNPEISDAFISYSIALIDSFKANGFDVSYFNYASEISELKLGNPVEYASFLSFAQRVYYSLKARYPQMKIFVSCALKHPQSSDRTTMEMAILSETNGNSHGPLIQYTDMMGISIYPYAFFHPPVSDEISERENELSDLPVDWVEQISSMSGGKAIAFTETGWIAQDLSIASFPLNRYSSELNQYSFMKELFSEAQRLEAEFIIWFSLVDYNHYWQNNLLSDDTAAIWKDIGLYDYDMTTDISLGNYENLPTQDAGLTPRMAMNLWRQWFAYPMHNH